MTSLLPTVELTGDRKQANPAVGLSVECWVMFHLPGISVADISFVTFKCISASSGDMPLAKYSTVLSVFVMCMCLLALAFIHAISTPARPMPLTAWRISTIVNPPAANGPPFKNYARSSKGIFPSTSRGFNDASASLFQWSV